MRTLRPLAWTALGALALAVAFATPHAADLLPARGEHPATPGRLPEQRPPATAPNPQIAQLDQQIKAMRDEFHAKLDPLQAQIKSLRDQYEPQLKTLEDQRSTLIEQGKSPDLQALDSQEKADLASLADREKAEIEGVRQRFADQRKDIQQKYAERRKEMSRH